MMLAVIKNGCEKVSFSVPFISQDSWCRT